MEFVNARDLRLNPKKVWQRIQRRSLGVVTINGRPSFLLSKLDASDLEEVIYIQNRIMAELALKKLRDGAREKGLDKLTTEQIDDIIQKTRKSKN